MAITKIIRETSLKVKMGMRTRTKKRTRLKMRMKMSTMKIWTFRRRSRPLEAPWWRESLADCGSRSAPTSAIDSQDWSIINHSLPFNYATVAGVLAPILSGFQPSHFLCSLHGHCNVYQWSCKVVQNDFWKLYECLCRLWRFSVYICLFFFFHRLPMATNHWLRPFEN